MALLPIITAPDPRLKVKSTAVERVDDELRRLLDSMLETMYDAPGIGLSAIQVGVPKRMMTIDVSDREEPRQPLFLINPRIVWVSETGCLYDEGCLSLPDQFAEIERPERVRVEYVDRDGKAQSLEADGLLARCVQHELDHLDGILFVDHLSGVKRNMILRKLAKAKRQQATG
ncbi:MAG TPA: peptide deformylase [Alphaproteobacteria bacterium]|jgi:peptide deformylase|nr:peptide deformylase [Alphaproteobacteria bacterium]